MGQRHWVDNAPRNLLKPSPFVGFSHFKGMRRLQLSAGDPADPTQIFPIYLRHWRKVLIEKVQHRHNSTMIAPVCPVGLSSTALLNIMFLEIHHV